VNIALIAASLNECSINACSIQDVEDPAVIMRRAIALLNKMTLEKFDKLSAAFVDVGFTTEVCVTAINYTTCELSVFM
jgi:hypothetical protein